MSDRRDSRDHEIYWRILDALYEPHRIKLLSFGEIKDAVWPHKVFGPNAAPRERLTRTVSHLEHEGILEAVRDPNGEDPDLYCITEAGRRFLRAIHQNGGSR